MRFLAVVFGATMLVTGAIAAPVDPYKVLNFPGDIRPNLRSPPVARIKAGPLSLQLETTFLEAIRRQFGGTIRRTGDAAGASDWICFKGNENGKSVIYWFISNAEMGGGRLTEVAIQESPDRDVLNTCSFAPTELIGVDLGFPSIGASLAIVTARFGGRAPDVMGYLGYAYERPTRRPTGGAFSQSVQYLVRDGRVRIVDVAQVTSF